METYVTFPSVWKMSTLAPNFMNFMMDEACEHERQLIRSGGLSQLSCYLSLMNIVAAHPPRAVTSLLHNPLASAGSNIPQLLLLLLHLLRALLVPISTST